MHLQFDALQSSLSFGDSPKPDFYSQIMSELIIEAGRAEKNYWRDLWRYRELFYFLAWRDILVRYKQTVMGVAWAVDASLPHDGRLHHDLQSRRQTPAPAAVPYALLVMAGMLPWQFFSPPSPPPQQPRSERQPRSPKSISPASSSPPVPSSPVLSIS